MNVFVIILLAAALIGIALWWAVRHQQAQRRFIDAYLYPPGIRARVRKRYPHLSDADLDRVLVGLTAWFHVSHAAGRRMVSMPSQVVDAAWHEFILTTRNYRDYCRRALGRFLHHVPAEAMKAPTDAQEGIRRAWRLSCAREGIDPRTPSRLPLLFALDSELAIADGFRYALDCSALTGLDRAAQATYCGAHIGCGSGGGDGGCSSDSGCSSGCGGGGGD